jgi:SAM-dependent methyltransferase
MKYEDNKGSHSHQLKDDFYSSLTLSQSYLEALDLAKPVPQEWYLALADIVESTQALSLGKYKEVNIAGAMGIMALGNMFGTLKRPFIFGGDGMSFLIPPEWVEQTKSVLGRVLWDVEQLFGLKIRGAVIPVSLINPKEFHFYVSKVRVSNTYQQAFFLGSGPALAEDLLKSESETIKPYMVAPLETAYADYQGFSCRWRDVPSPNGETAAIIIEPRDSKTLRFVYGEVERILGSFDFNYPLSSRSMKLAGKTSSWVKQVAVVSQGKPRFLYYLEWIKQFFILGIMKLALTFKVPIKHGVYDLSRVNEMNVESSDTHKIDTGIKTIISCETQTLNRLVQRLEQLRDQGMLYYGIHRTTAAHITCIASMGSNDDIHFVDATGGGYALAAKQVKEQKQKELVIEPVPDTIPLKEQTEQRFDTLCPIYEELFPLGPKTLDFVLCYTKQDSKVLDLGSSTGQLLRALAEQGRYGIGIDLSSESIALAKQKLQLDLKGPSHRVEFIHGDIFDFSNLISSDMRFQTILCLGNTLPHAQSLKQLEDLCTQSYRYLDSQGVMIISMLHYDSILTEPNFQFPLLEYDEYRFCRSYGELDQGRLPFHTQLFFKEELKSHESSSLLPISIKQLDRIIKKVGFSRVSWYQDYQSNDLETDSIMVVGVFFK